MIILVPFVFLPTTLTTGFTLSNDHPHVSTTDDQATITDRKEKKENEEGEEEEKGGAGMCTYTDEKKKSFFVIEWLFDIRIITIFVCILEILKWKLINEVEKQKNLLLFFSTFFSETIDDDEADHSEEEKNDRTDEKSDLRISQPKYSQLLKELDFSHTRMVKKHNLFFYFESLVRLVFFRLMSQIFSRMNLINKKMI